jgi:GNAT superfamily N-acetyltransferase
MFERAEWIEAEAWADAIDRAPQWLRAAVGGRVLRLGSAMALCAQRADSLLFNRLFAGTLGPRRAEPILDDVLAYYDTADVRRFFVHVDAAEPRWSELLERRDLRRFHRPWIKLARTRSTAVAPLRSAVPVGAARPDEAQAYGRVLAQGLGGGGGAAALLAATVKRRGWTTFVARDEGHVVAAAGLFVRDGIAYLAGAATVPTHRRRGIQGALVARRVELALDMGCTVIASETGAAVAGEANSSYNNMLRCGLRPIATIHNFTPPRTRWDPMVTEPDVPPDP